MLNPLDRVTVVWDDNTKLTGMLVEHNADYAEVLGNDAAHHYVPRNKIKEIIVDRGLSEDGFPDGWDDPDDDDDDEPDIDPLGPDESKLTKWVKKHD